MLLCEVFAPVVATRNSPTTHTGHTKKKILNRRWKYYVTYIQLTQFALNTVEYIHSRYNNCNGYPVWIQVRGLVTV